MGSRGPTPKPASERRRRNRTPEVVTLVHDRGVRGPELPDNWEWPPETREWWQTWRESAQAQLFTPVDWSYLLDTARLHAEYWLGNLSVEAGLRIRVGKFGATPSDRERLHVAIGEPAGPAAKIRSTARDRRRLLTAIGEDDKPAS